MKEKQNKKLYWILTVITLVSFILFIYADHTWNDPLIGISGGLMVVSLLILFIHLIKTYEIPPKLEKRLWVVSFLLLSLIFISIIVDITSVAILPLLIFLFIAGSLVFLPQHKTILRLSLLLLAIVGGFTMKKFHLPLSSFAILFTTGCLAAGSLLLGFSIILKKKNIPYYRFVVSICLFLVSISAIAIMFKYQHWPGAGIFVILSTAGVLVMTLFVLITLPGSGFIKWGTEQKRDLTRKTLIPWIFILVLFALRTLLPPQMQKAIFESDQSKIEPFEMDRYQIELKEGMEDNESETE